MPQERKHHIDNNLCLYCGKPGHKATECTAPPNHHPQPLQSRLWQITMINEEDETEEVSQDDTGINVLNSNHYQVLNALKDSNSAMQLDSF